MKSKRLSNSQQFCVFLFLLKVAQAADVASYSSINGSLCVNGQFVRSLPDVASMAGCAFWCSSDWRCQAFSLADGPCQLFVFDKCSKSVRDCGCSRRGRVFVKQQPGLEAGALCPSGYGDDLCGVKYKVYNETGNWQQSRQKCESESGLVIMADVEDATEMSHVNDIHRRRSSGKFFFLGGYKKVESSDPKEGWQWVACDIPLNGSLWNDGEPSGGGLERAIARYHNLEKLVDIREAIATVSKVLCECVSPFN